MATGHLEWIEIPKKEDENMEELYSARGIICESLAFMLGQKYSENQQLEKEVSNLKEELVSVEKNWSEAEEDNDNLVSLLKEARNCIHHRERTITQQKEIIQEKSQKIQEFESKIAENTEESKKKDDKIEFLENLVGGLQREAIRLEKALEQAEKRREKELEEMERKWQEKLRDLEEKSGRSSGILDSLVDLTKKKEKLIAKLQRRDKMIAELRSQVSLLEKQKEEDEEHLEQLYTTAAEEFDPNFTESGEEKMFLSAADEFDGDFPENESKMDKINGDEANEANKQIQDPFKEPINQENEEESDLDEIEWDLVMEAFNNCYADLQSSS